MSTAAAAAAAANNNNNNNDHANDGGLLLSLPQSDLPNTKKTSVKKDLVLLQLPRNDQDFRKELLQGKCQIIANNESSTVVSSNQTHKLITVGTSNALVVWKKKQEEDAGRQEQENNTVDKKDTADEPDKKRMKPTSSRAMLKTNCRLVQPGGSGSSFLVGQLYQVESTDVLNFFLKQKQGLIVSTSRLCNLFQSSAVQIHNALSKLPNVVPIEMNTTTTKNDNTQSSHYWQLIVDEEILFGQRVLVELLSEEDIMDSQTTNSTQSCYDVAIQLCERLEPQLLDQDTESSSKEQRSLGIALKTVWMAQQDTTKQMNDIPFNVDHDKVRCVVYRITIMLLFV
jgi:transposase-like protein